MTPLFQHDCDKFMKHIQNLNDLEQYGISLLTGEADRFCIGRILCDLNQDGVNLVTVYFGLQSNGLLKNWNSQVNGQPAIASIMLSREALRELARFALLSVDQFDVVVQTVDGLMGMNNDDMYNQKYLKMAELNPDIKIYRNMVKRSTSPGAGSRNQHMMSGRVA